jgi:2',3'-cyclic-nucleotide 2'-phosphodiesterase (5'-nucleotidase family)
VARWATFIHRQADPDAAWLTVDAGDYVDRIGNGGCSSKCQFMVVSYRDLKYDVLNVGKQEAWMGYETLKSIIDTIKGTQFVSANLIEKKSKRPMTEPYVIRDFGKMRVGIMGMLYEGDFPRGTSLLDSTKLAVMPYMDAAKKYVPSLAGKVDAIVLLAELPTGALDTLCKAYPQISLVISTGALRSGETLTTIGKTRVIGTGSSGYSGHFITMAFNGDSISYTPYQDQLTDSYDEKGTWADKLAAFNASPPPNKPNPTPASTSVKPIPAPAPTTTQKPTTTNKG